MLQHPPEERSIDRGASGASPDSNNRTCSRAGDASTAPESLPARTDAELLEAVLRKDEPAWRELMRRFRPLMFRCIHKVAGRFGELVTREDVDEIFAEVCFNLWRDDLRKLRAYDATRGARLGTWLGLIAIHTTYDDLRSRRRRPPVDKLDVTAERPSPGPDALDLLLEKERWDKLRALMADCSDKDRRFIELYYGEGLEPEQIAERMCISVKTVYSKKNKLRGKLEGMTARRPVEEAAADRVADPERRPAATERRPTPPRLRRPLAAVAA